VRRLRWWIWFVVSLALVSGIPAGASEVVRPCEQLANSVLIQVQGVRSSGGALVAVLYGDNPSEFLKKGARVARERVQARPGSVTVCLEAPRPGVYAVAVYHDENDNHRFDRSWTGLPVEGFGVSNNPRPFLRAPTHGESAFEVGPGHRLVKIDLRY
jgi:uncharacterized protein (DUF2141 family)